MYAGPMQAFVRALPLWLLGAGCGPSPDLPHVKPPVEATVPTGLGGKHIGLLAPTLDAANIKQQFFVAGPTDVFLVLQHVDGMIDEVNSGSDCDNTPVEYTVHAWGHDVTAFAKCSNSFDPSGFVQWNKDDAGATDLFTRGPAGSILAHVTPTATDGKYNVHTWITIAGNNPDPCMPHGSYGVIELSADESTGAFEMAVAGDGFGYCGAQLRSDGTNVYVTGSTEVGNMTCNAVDTLCGMASDVSVAGTCGTSVTTMSLPAAGLAAAPACNHGESAYPGGSGNLVNTDGSAGDSIQAFGPATPTI